MTGGVTKSDSLSRWKVLVTNATEEWEGKKWERDTPLGYKEPHQVTLIGYIALSRRVNPAHGDPNRHVRGIPG